MKLYKLKILWCRFVAYLFGWQFSMGVDVESSGLYGGSQTCIVWGYKKPDGSLYIIGEEQFKSGGLKC